MACKNHFKITSLFELRIISLRYNYINQQSVRYIHKLPHKILQSSST
jgi:hypothetical protein